MTGRNLPTRRRFLAVVGASALAGCSSPASQDTTDAPDETADPDDDSDDEPTAMPPGSDDFPRPSDDPDWRPADGSPLAADVEPEILVENLEVPWDVAFAGTEEMFITERTGTVKRFDNGEVSTVVSPEDAIDAGAVEPGSDEDSWLVEGGEGGTLGVATHPEYPDPAWIYVYYTADADGGVVNRVVRYDVDGDTSEREVIVDDIPGATYHNGGRISFGPDGNLWICTGDALEEELAQDPGSLAGKVLRVTPAGDAPDDNPDLGDGADPRVFTVGHRNPQGISWLPSGVPIVNEHGPSARDEVNILRPGGNYGWDEARGGPDDPDYDNYADHDEYVPPIANTGPGDTWAPTGSVFYTGDDVPAWQNRHVMGGLISQQVVVLTLTPNADGPPSFDDDHRRFDADWFDDAYHATAHTTLQNELGRIRLVTQSPNGELYAITSNRDGRAEHGFPTERNDVLVRLTIE